MSLLAEGGAPYLQRIQLMPERVQSFDPYPFNLPVIRNLDLQFRTPITFLIGENGSGKSTITEAVASLLNLPLTGGGTADIGLRYGPQDDHALARAIRPNFRMRPHDAYVFRGEFVSHFAKLLDERNDDPWFRMTGDPYNLSGGTSLFNKSHGEGFLSVMQNRIAKGLFILDEPEAALSPQRQLVLMAMIAERAKEGAQFIVATHSPILMTIPTADLLMLENETISRVKLEDTEHYQVTKAVLQDPALFWKRLTHS